jgi:hypothetical protein
MFQDVVLTYTVGWAEEIRIDFCYCVTDGICDAEMMI